MERAPDEGWERRYSFTLKAASVGQRGGERPDLGQWCVVSGEVGAHPIGEGPEPRQISFAHSSGVPRTASVATSRPTSSTSRRSRPPWTARSAPAGRRPTPRPRAQVRTPASNRRRRAGRVRPSRQRPVRLDCAAQPDDHLRIDRQVVGAASSTFEAFPHRGERSLPEVSNAVERHDQQSVGHLRGRPRHHRSERAQTERRRSVRDWDPGLNVGGIRVCPVVNSPSNRRRRSCPPHASKIALIAEEPSHASARRT